MIFTSFFCLPTAPFPSYQSKKHNQVGMALVWLPPQELLIEIQGSNRNERLITDILKPFPYNTVLPSAPTYPMVTRLRTQNTWSASSRQQIWQVMKWLLATPLLGEPSCSLTSLPSYLPFVGGVLLHVLLYIRGGWHARNVIAFFVWAWPSGFCDWSSFPWWATSWRGTVWSYQQKGGSTPRTLIPVWTLPLRHISSSLCVARPFTNGVEWGWKKCTDPMVGGARSMTRAHPIARENPWLQMNLVQSRPFTSAWNVW